jgi:putative hydrolase of the HAD superfamily
MKDKHLFFDLDRTLWDFEKNSENALRQIFKETGTSNRIENFDKFLRIYKSENALLWKKYGKGKITKEYLRDARFSRTLMKFEIYDNDLSKELGQSYIDVSPYQTELLPNAIETLTYLQKLGYKMHIITNGFKEVQHIKLEKSKLTPFFDFILCSEEVGVNKPDPAIFAHALKNTGAIASHSVMIGDDYNVDVMGAVRSGLHGVHFDPQFKRKDKNGDWQIRDLEQLPAILPWILK